MNMHTGRLVQGAPVREYASAAELHAHAKEVRARLMGPTPKARPYADVAAPILLSPAATTGQPAKRWVLVEEEEARRLAAQEAERAAVAEGEAAQPEALPPVAFTTRAQVILRAIAAHHGVTVSDIRGRVLTARMVRPRHQAMVAIWIECRHLSLPQIGRLIGGRDHTTILHALQKLGVSETRAWTPALFWLRNLLADKLADAGGERA